MKELNESMRTIRALSSAIFVATTLTVGCSAPNAAPNPVAGWNFRTFDQFATPRDQHHYSLDKSIARDYEGFIAKEKLSLLGAVTGFFEDGKGQHAVEFEALRPNENSSWRYVLIYDKRNNRSKVVKCDHRRYQS